MEPPAFLSRQVREGRYFFLDLRTSASSSKTVVLCGGMERCRPEYRVERPHGFFCHGIELVVGGSGRYQRGGSTYALEAGSLYHYGPGEPHVIATEADAPMVKFFVDFVGATAEKLIQGGPFVRPAPVLLHDYWNVLRLFESLQMAGTPKTRASGDICSRLLEAILLSAADVDLRRTEDVSASRRNYIRCRNVVQQEFKTLKSLEDIARLCHVDASQLCRSFRRHGDSSPYKLLIQLKMRHAAEVLASGGRQVKEAAAEVGYENVCLFSKVFKRIHGLPPSNFPTNR